jgi:hypothetical protein
VPQNFIQIRTKTHSLNIPHNIPYLDFNKWVSSSLHIHSENVHYFPNLNNKHEKLDSINWETI